MQPVERQGDGERRAESHVALGRQRTFMSSDDRPADRQPQAHAFRLRGDERFKCRNGIVEADSVIGDLDYASRPLARFDRTDSCFTRPLTGSKASSALSIRFSTSCCN